jgi:hypothetical protein
VNWWRDRCNSNLFHVIQVMVGRIGDNAGISLTVETAQDCQLQVKAVLDDIHYGSCPMSPSSLPIQASSNQCWIWKGCAKFVSN